MNHMIIVGNPFVGKTSFINLIKKEPFNESYNPTINVYKTTTESFGLIEIPMISKMTEDMIENCINIIIMVAANDLDSFKSIETYYNEYKKYNITFIICINKYELYDNSSEKEAILNKYKGLHVMKISVKNKDCLFL